MTSAETTDRTITMARVDASALASHLALRIDALTQFHRAAEPHLPKEWLADAQAVVAAANARLNGFTDFETAAIDLRAAPDRRFPVLLAADVCYELRLTEAVAAYIHAALAPGGLALVTDTDRHSARPFRGLLEQAGLSVAVSPVKTKTGEPGGMQKGYLYRITHPPEA